jgi:carboxymethylenebutenolidase
MRDTLNDMQLYLVDEYVEDYQEGLLSRRDALRRIAAITGSMVFASSLLAACGPAESIPTGTENSTAAAPQATLPRAATQEPAVTSTSASTAEPAATSTGAATAEPAATSTGAATAGAAATSASAATADPAVSVPENDPEIMASMVEFPGEGATLKGYLARPTGDGPFPVILVCHENRGLTPHIQDVTRRVAKAGYVGLAVDLLSRQGGTSTITDQNEISGLLGQLPEGQPVQDFQSGLRYLQSQPFADGARSGMVGFCYGGGVTWRVATKTPDLRAAVPFYGSAPQVVDVPGIQAAVLAIYAEQDQRINASIPEIEAAMQQNNKTFEKVIYPGVNHAFHNDTGPRYNREQATAAWSRTLAWFDQYVKT